MENKISVKKRLSYKSLSFCTMIALLLLFFSSTTALASTNEIAIYNVKTGMVNIDEIEDVDGNARIEAERPTNYSKRINLTEDEKELFKKAINLDNEQVDILPDIKQKRNNYFDNSYPIMANLAMNLATTSDTSDEMDGIIGNDDRTLVSNVSTFPYYSVCKLVVTFASDPDHVYLGTGFAVGRNLCCTARHCITDSTGAFPTSVTAYYGYAGGSYTYKATDVSYYIYSPAYTYGGIINDYAFISWQNTNSGNTGCFGMQENATIGTALDTAGYPSEQGYNGEWMYKCSGTLTNTTNDNLYFNMDVAKGQSGSPIYVNASSGPYVNGIITHKTGAGYNIGYRINSDLIQWLIDNGHI